MTIQQYLEIVKNRYKSGISREHSYRGDLETLIRSIAKDVEITNEPTNVTDCGNPDYVITKGKIPVGYIEAKDIGKDLNDKHYKEQFNRYKKALDNLTITDYIWFQFFQNGELVHEIRIAEIDGNTIKPLPNNFGQFENLIQDFCTFVGQTIKSAKRLAEMMAGKARLLENILERAIITDEATQENTSLKEQYGTFKQILIHDLSPKGFADIYAQTLAYGMFAARLHDPTLNTFSRQEAAELIPKTNPFLRRLFQYVAGYDIDERIKTTVDNLADVFRATNVEAMLQSFGKTTKTEDPIIHFYETFLSEYDPSLRKSRGVWYTPQPVVNFIVRSVDEILKTEFDLPQGLADTAKTKIKINSQGKKIEQEVHRVQILDPATGTGTFLAEVVRQIYSNFEGMQGIWSNYVETHLLPRLNGFELLMASYAMAHLKLDMLLADTGFKPTTNQRLKVYLTNSLEEHHPDTGTLFAHWLSTEANEANYIKRDTPVMCIIGNPPYAVSSNNKSEWIQNLITDYKKDLNERKINLDDDYIKFIRLGQYYIDKNGSGILAYISNNSFIDGITHRQMRKSLLESFDQIYILDLHGNAKKKEVCPDGSLDQNVFDIMQGVSINIFVKIGLKKKTELGQVFHYDLQGKRESKYSLLSENTIKSIQWKLLEYTKPNLFFVPKNFDEICEYEKGFKIDVLLNCISGIETKRDHFALDFNLTVLKERITDFVTNEYSSLERKKKFDLRDNEWVVDEAVLELRKKNNWQNSFVQCITRPFDFRWIIYDSTILSRDRGNLMAGMNKENFGLILGRQSKEDFAALVTNHVCTHKIVTVYDRSFIFPLYIYNYNSEQQTIEQSTRKPNLNLEIVNKIASSLGLTFTTEKETTENTFAPIDLLDYIYAVLHSPTYRERYKEFLKIDFPRVPYPKDQQTFWQLVKLGGELRQVHLLESPIVNKPITQYPVDGDNIVRKISFIGDFDPSYRTEQNRVYINDTQYFDRVPSVAWNFYIGGYQPAQKWLKDRKDRKLEFEDIQHYSKIIVALTETDRLMRLIDEVDFN